MERKKLLILGGSFYLLPLIEKAHELGVYVITADYLPDNAAHKYADEYHNVSVIDKEAVLNLAKELKIDGVTAFVNDIAATTAAYVAEKLGLNFQCPYESAVILQDKGKFRKFLSDNGFNSPHSKRYDDVNAPMNDIDYFDWPVIVKPTDSCGSRGVTKVEKPEDLPSAIMQNFSKCALIRAFCSAVFFSILSETTYEVASFVITICVKRSFTCIKVSETKLKRGLSNTFS